jgi:phosphate-selective porin OprO/OprP
MRGMVWHLWEKVARFVTPGCAALLVATGTARADDAEELQRLKAEVEYLKKVVDGGLVPAQAEAADKKTVEKIVADYLKKQDSEKKKKDEEKKKADEAAGFEVGKDTTFKASWKDAPYFETADKAFKVQLRGRWHNDWGWNTADGILVDPDDDGGAPGNLGQPLDDGVIFRRARLGVQGTIWEVFDYVAEFEFANANNAANDQRVTFREVWMGTNTPFGQIKVGHFKEYFSLEQLTSSRFLTFIERSIIDGPVDDILAYNTGISLGNTYADERGTWAIGAFRQTDPQGTDLGDGEFPSVTGRVTFLPLWENDGRHLVHLGLGATWHKPSDDTLSGASLNRGAARWRTRPYRIDPVAFLDTGTLFPDDFYAIGPEFALVLGPFSVQAEYHLWKLNSVFTGGEDRGDIDFRGYYIYASYFLTGENRNYRRTNATFDRIRPYENFFAVREGDGCGHGLCCGKGAWEIAARWAHLDLADGFFSAPGDDVPPGFGECDQFTIGVNWYWNPNMKVQFNYEWFDLERIGEDAANPPHGDIKTFVIRFAWDF